MARYIDADALKKKVRNECLMPDWCHVLIDVAIANSPTIEERKKGKWRCTDAFPHWLYCDQCYKRIVPNKEWVELYNIPTNYCPNCGAKMEEKNDGK